MQRADKGVTQNGAGQGIALVPVGEQGVVLQVQDPARVNAQLRAARGNAVSVPAGDDNQVIVPPGQCLRGDDGPAQETLRRGTAVHKGGDLFRRQSAVDELPRAAAGTIYEDIHG